LGDADGPRKVSKGPRRIFQGVAVYRQRRGPQKQITRCYAVLDYGHSFQPFNFSAQKISPKMLSIKQESRFQSFDTHLAKVPKMTLVSKQLAGKAGQEGGGQQRPFPSPTQDSLFSRANITHTNNSNLPVARERVTEQISHPKSTPSPHYAGREGTARRPSTVWSVQAFPIPR